VAAWHQYIRSVRERRFSSDADSQTFAKGQVQLQALREPLVIPAACRALAEGDERTRTVLTEILGGYGEDSATLNLLVMALLDASPEVRGAAGSQLSRRSDFRIPTFLRRTLSCELETILHRGADSLARLGDKSVLDDLIVILPTSGMLSRRISAEELFDQLTDMFSEPTQVPVGDTPFALPASIAFPSYRRAISAIDARDEPPTGEFRSYVQDALIAITGENFGFDVGAWREWVARHGADEPGSP
jgi:HEAT repeat protein